MESCALPTGARSGEWPHRHTLPAHPWAPASLEPRGSPAVPVSPAVPGGTIRGNDRLLSLALFVVATALFPVAFVMGIPDPISTVIVIVMVILVVAALYLGVRAMIHPGDGEEEGPPGAD